jgi:pyruvate,orthophosphate dikinase
VVFTRNPSTGEAAPFGDFLLRAQGEEVVAGTAQTQSIDSMAKLLPGAYDELRRHLCRLEIHYRDICDVEFTVERGRLWILQTRVGKRGAVAAVRAAVEMVDDPLIRLTTQEAVARVPGEVRDRARDEILAWGRQGSGSASPVAVGLGASPGRATGMVVLDADAAAMSDGPVILVRPETNPEDVAGMSVSVGILTSSGGMVSHAAVVARGWGIPAVVGAESLTVGPDEVRDRDGTLIFAAGDTITVDGTSGEVWLGAPEETSAGSTESDEEILGRHLPQLGQLESWAGASAVPVPEA